MNGYAIGAILSQRKIGVDQLVAYASRILNGTECMTQKEWLAILFTSVGK